MNSQNNAKSKEEIHSPNQSTFLDAIRNADLKNLRPVKVEPKIVPTNNSITEQIKKALDERRWHIVGGKYSNYIICSLINFPKSSNDFKNF